MTHLKKPSKTPRIPPVSERDVSKACVVVFKLYAWAIDIQRNNIAGFTNTYGHKVRCGIKGDCDYTGMFRKYGGPWDGRKLGVEIKKERFNPERLSRRDQAHFNNQLLRMKDINNNGGVAFWVSDAVQLSLSLPKILAGARIEFDEIGWPYMEM